MDWRRHLKQQTQYWEWNTSSRKILSKHIATLLIPRCFPSTTQWSWSIEWFNLNKKYIHTLLEDYCVEFIIKTFSTGLENQNHSLDKAMLCAYTSYVSEFVIREESNPKDGKLVSIFNTYLSWSSVATRPILLTTSIPSPTLPNILCLPIKRFHLFSF
jgi:hypothetical protein